MILTVVDNAVDTAMHEDGLSIPIPKSENKSHHKELF